MYCANCGQQIFPNPTGTCPNCGAPIGQNAPTDAVPPQYAPPPYVPPVPPYRVSPMVSYEDADTLLKILCFFVPLVGIILYFVDRDTKPVAAKQCLNLSLIGLGVSVGVSILAAVVWLFIIFGMLA